VAAPDEEMTDEIAGKGDSGNRTPGLAICTGENDRDDSVGTADGIARCRTGIATEATSTAVQADNSNFG
jgi:hypothetical protein